MIFDLFDCFEVEIIIITGKAYSDTNPNIIKKHMYEKSYFSQAGSVFF